MSETLFDLPDSPSPKLQWMREHRLGIKFRDDLSLGAEQWECWKDDYERTVLKVFGDGETLSGESCDPDWNPDFVMAESEQDALVEMAKRNNWKLWNENKMKTLDQLFNQIQQWGRDKGITGPNGKATLETQYAKLSEEAHELCHGIETNNKAEISDAIGDCMVVLALMADLHNQPLDRILSDVYDIISKRKGRMVDGVFVKEQ